MRNKTDSKIYKIIEAASTLPYFNFGDLSPIIKDKVYLKKVFYRYVKSGRLIRLKKGAYVTKEKIQEIKIQGAFSSYCEFLANRLRHPSYLSSEYILSKNGLLTDAVFSFTSVAKTKTMRFENKFGKFLYRKIKGKLYCGFNIQERDGFTIFEATKAKALFDFLYLRKNDLLEKSSIEELRLNLEELSRGDITEFKKYIKLESSAKMAKIAKCIIELL